MLVCVYRTLSVTNLININDKHWWYIIYNNNIISRVYLYSISRYKYTKGSSRQMVLDLLIWLKLHVDRTLSFRSSCCEGVCGSCAMLINNTNTLVCIQPIWLVDSYVIIYPFGVFNIIRDVVIDLKHFYDQYYYISPFYSNVDSTGFSNTIFSIVYTNSKIYNSFMNGFLYLKFNKILYNILYSKLFITIYYSLLYEYLFLDIINISRLNILFINRSLITL